MIGSAAFTLLLLIAALPANTAPEHRKFSCWDNSFAYTAAGIRWASETAEICLITEDRGLLEPLLKGRGGDWGATTLSVAFPQNACRINDLRRSFECAGTPQQVFIRLDTFAAEVAAPQTISAAHAIAKLEVTDGAELGAKDHEGLYRAFTLTLRPMGKSEGESLADIQIGPLHWNADCSSWPDPFGRE